MRVALEQDLTTLEMGIGAQALRVRELLGGALGALRAGDVELADAVIDGDDPVDDAYLEIRQSVEQILALQHPVAGDLRLVLAVLDANVHLERMGDYCVTIAKLTRLVCELRADDDMVEQFTRMGEQADRMIAVAVSSLLERDVEAAEQLVEMDEIINRANRKAARRILALGVQEDVREWGLRMLLVSRCLERIGDHAVDIGEQTAFLVTGEFREFTDASNPTD